MIKLDKSQAALLAILLTVLLVFTGCSKPEKALPKEQKNITPTLYYIGHASIKIKTSKGLVIYIDPSYGDDYSEPADIVLVTHFHEDHYRLDKLSTAKKYKLITPTEAIKNGIHQKFDVLGIKIESVPAYNSNHSITETVGYILEFDGIKLYHAGDTSKIKEMSTFASKNITYALLPMDGVYNMGPEEATEVANIIKAKYYIPIHTSADETFSQENVDKFKVNNKVVMKPGTKIELKK